MGAPKHNPTARFDIDELIRIARLMFLDDTELAPVLNVDKRSLTRWRKYGIPFNSADAVACHLGFHPMNIWPEYELVPFGEGISTKTRRYDISDAARRRKRRRDRERLKQ